MCFGAAEMSSSYEGGGGKEEVRNTIDRRENVANHVPIYIRAYCEFELEKPFLSLCPLPSICCDCEGMKKDAKNTKQLF